VHRAAVAASGEETLRLMAEETFDPRTGVVLEEEPGVPLHGGEEASVAEIISSEPSEVVVRCRLAGAGILVLSDTFYPGWEATVDGSPGRILRANYAFRAVPLERGEHTVRFNYQPASFRAGAAVSVISLCAVAIALRVSCRRRGGWTSRRRDAGRASAA